MTTTTKICVIFDLDETLIHFVDEINYLLWKNTSRKKQKKTGLRGKHGKTKRLYF